MSKGENNDRITVPVTSDFKEQLKTIGGKHGRNLTSTLEHALKVYVALHDQEGNMKCSVDNILLGQQIRFGTAEELQGQFETFMGYVKELRTPVVQTVSAVPINPATSATDDVSAVDKVDTENEVEVEIDF